MKSIAKLLTSSVLIGIIAFLLTIASSWEVFAQKAPGLHGFATATITTTTSGKSQKVKVVSKTFGYYTERVNSEQFEKAIWKSLREFVKEKYGENVEVENPKVITSFALSSIEKKHKLALADKSFAEIVEFTPKLADELPGTFACPIRK